MQGFALVGIGLLFRTLAFVFPSLDWFGDVAVFVGTLTVILSTIAYVVITLSVCLRRRVTR